MIQDSKYFFWGIYESGTPVYSLYEPITDSFLIVSKSLETITKLKYILSSRFSTHLCRLDLASNFSSELIDNSCCENWSFVNKYRDIKLDENLTNAKTIIAEELCPSAGDLEWNIEKEKQWSLFCHAVLEKYDKFLFNQYSQVISVLGRFLNFDKFENNTGVSSNTEKQILSKLYFGLDIDDTEQQINKLLTETHSPLLFL
jgi:hypothetical protein